MAMTIAVTERDQLGSKVKALRRAGLTPANLVCGGKASRSIQANSLQLQKLLNAVGYTQPIQLDFEDKSQATVLVTDIKFHPAKGSLQHVTFQEVKQGQKMIAEVPIVLLGDAPGTQQGLILIQTLYAVEVEAGALNLPQQLEIDISSLEENAQAVRIKEIKLPDGAVIQAEPEEPVARLEMPRLKISQDQEEAEGEAEEGEEGQAEEGDLEGQGGDSSQEGEDQADDQSGDHQPKSGS